MGHVQIILWVISVESSESCLQSSTRQFWRSNDLLVLFIHLEYFYPETTFLVLLLWFLVLWFFTVLSLSICLLLNTHKSEHFRGHVLHWTWFCVATFHGHGRCWILIFPLHSSLTEPKSHNLKASKLCRMSAIDRNVIGLNVPVYDTVAVQVLRNAGHLCRKSSEHLSLDHNKTVVHAKCCHTTRWWGSGPVTKNCTWYISWHISLTLTYLEAIAVS